MWDFSTPKKFVYSYYQHINSVAHFGEARVINKGDITGTGKINVRVKEDGLADISITDLTVDMVQFDETGAVKDTANVKGPTNVMQNMQPDGQFDDPVSDMIFGLLFPLPSFDLKKDEEDIIPLTLPVNTMGMNFLAKGTITLAHRGIKKIDSRNCVVMTGEIDISELELPEGISGDFSNSITGRASYYFDTRNNYYVGSDIDFRIDSRMKADEENNPGRQDINFELFSENSFRIRLVAIEK